MKKKQLFLIASLTGILLALAWPTFGFAPILFIALVPILWVENHIADNKEKFSKFAVFNYSFFAFLIFNLLTSYWIVYATFFGLFAPFLNAFLGGLVFQTYHNIKKILFNNSKGFFVLPILWISIEFLHHHWELTWPWMTFGNGFSTKPIMVQWYEYTGAFGGSLWVWITNYFAYQTIKQIGINDKVGKLKLISKKLFTTNLLKFALIIIIPISLSLIIWTSFEEEKNAPVDVVVLQPNLEPYDETKMLSNNQIVNLLISLSEQKADQNTSFILAPEGCLEERIWEDQIQDNYNLSKLSNFISKYPKSQLIVGSFTRRLQTEEERTEASRKIEFAPLPYYSVYNSAIQIKQDNNFNLYHKSKLVPGVERLPFKKYIGKILDFAIKLGNLPVGTLAVDDNHNLFESESSKVKITTPICYESIYGEFVAKRVREGAGIIFIITNDSWWRDTQGYKQHASYASLRAIETRRPIARSANTGTSCFISPKGEVSQKTKFWEQDVIKASLVPQTKLTFYVKYGDYIARICLFSSILIILIGIVYKVKLRNEKK
ncbi:MAG: apolipoprotein N-acyltransferase [Bacteroidales bacterium]